MRVKVLIQVLDNTRRKMKVTVGSPVLDTLYCDRNSTKKSEFHTTEAELLALQICHFDSQFSYQKMINV